MAVIQERDYMKQLTQRLLPPAPVMVYRYCVTYHDADGFHVGTHGDYRTYGEASLSMGCHAAEHLLGMGYDIQRVTSVVSKGYGVVRKTNPATGSIHWED